MLNQKIMQLAINERAILEQKITKQKYETISITQQTFQKQSRKIKLLIKTKKLLRHLPKKGKERKKMNNLLAYFLTYLKYSK